LVTNTKNLKIISNGNGRVGLELSKQVLSVVTWILETTKRDAGRHDS